MERGKPNETRFKYHFDSLQVYEVIIGKDLYKFSPYRQNQCIPIVKNLYKLKNLQTLSVADRSSFLVFGALSEELFHLLHITDLTLTLASPIIIENN